MMKSKVRGRTTAKQLAMVAGLSFLAACAVSGQDTELASSSTQALSSIPPEMASSPSVYVQWQTVNQLGTQAANAAPLTVVMTNTTAAQLSVNLDLDSTGLDQRNAVFSFGSFTIPANGRSTFSFPPSQLPVQSVGTESKAKVRVSLVRTGAPTLQIASPPLSYEFDSTYTNVTFYGTEGKDFVQNVQPPTDPTS